LAPINVHLLSTSPVLLHFGLVWIQRRATLWQQGKILIELIWWITFIICHIVLQWGEI
jgi:hypothetical protein